MGGGASQLNTTVQEHHDMEPRLDELSPDIFSLPNVQVMIYTVSTDRNICYLFLTLKPLVLIIFVF